MNNNAIVNAGNITMNGATLSGVSFLDIDGQVLTADAENLFLNGTPIATISAIPNLAEWSQYDAISDIVMNGVGISGQPFSVRGAKLYTFSDSSTLSVSGGSLLFNGTPIGGASGGVNQWSLFPAVSSVNLGGNNIGNVLNVHSSTMTADTSITTPTTLTTNIQTQNIYTPASQNLNITANGSMGLTANNNVNIASTTANINLNAGVSGLYNQTINLNGGQTNITSDQGINAAAYSDINILAQNGNRGRVNITANGGFQNGVYGEVNIVANGQKAGSVGSGGLITMVANDPTGLSNATSAIKINAASVLSYAGYRGALASLAGYNYIYGTLGVNIVASLLPSTLPNVPGTCYLYGDTGIELGSTTYVSALYPYWNGVGSVGNLLISSRSVGLSTGYVDLEGVKKMSMSSDALITGVATITGASSGCEMTNIKSIQGSNISISNVSNITGSTASFSNITSSNATISNTATIGTLNTSTINGGALAIGGTSINLNSGSGITRIQAAECDIIATNTYISNNCFTDNLTSSNTTISNTLNSVAINNVLFPSKRFNATSSTPVALSIAPILLYETPDLTWNWNNIPYLTSSISINTGVDTAATYAYSASIQVGGTLYPFNNYTLDAPFVATSGSYNGVNLVSATLADSISNTITNGSTYKVLIYMWCGSTSVANTTGSKITINLMSGQNL